MKIGDAARETGLSVSNIRFYEKKGLLKPGRREDSKYREYGQEDVRRLKEIMLLRRMGVSIERIGLLYEGKIELAELLHRQQEELREKAAELNGALELCRKFSEETSMDEVEVDMWLSYVCDQEQKGGKFPEAEEFLEDLAEFSKISSFRYDPYVGKFFQRNWVARSLAVLLALSLVLTAFAVWIKGAWYWRHAAAWFWGCYLAALGINFFYYRRWRHRDEKEEE